jgi:GNAT superfamily N-acetyltransferase
MLVRHTYGTFNKNEGTEEAVAGYLNHYDPRRDFEAIQERFLRTPIFLVATAGDEMVGILRGTEKRVINLFVRGDQHRRGIGSALLSRYESLCRGTGAREIKLRATIYAVPFYEAQGYKRTTGIRNLDGLRVQPMKKRLV